MNLRKCTPSLGLMVGDILTRGNDDLESGKEFYFTSELVCSVVSKFSLREQGAMFIPCN